MYHIAYHLEAQRRQRVIERKHDALDRLIDKLEQDNKRRIQGKADNDEKPQTRAGTRMATRALQTRTGTRAVHSRDTLCLPDICGTMTGSAYYRQLIAPKHTLHHWRDLKNRVRHDYNLVPKPYKDEHIVKR